MEEGEGQACAVVPENVSLCPVSITVPRSHLNHGGRGRSVCVHLPERVGNAVSHAHFRERVWLRAVEKAMDSELCTSLGMQVLSRAPTIHDLRHTHASWLIARGVPLPYVQARLGHESITTTVNVYGHLVADAHEQMASAIATTLTEIRKPRSITEDAEKITRLDKTVITVTY